MPYARRTDSNLTAIVTYARTVGFKVHVTNGDWDATVQFARLTELWEVKKDRKAKHTDRQKKLKDQGFDIKRVETQEDVDQARRRMLGIATNPSDAWDEWKRKP